MIPWSFCHKVDSGMMPASQVAGSRITIDFSQFYSSDVEEHCDVRVWLTFTLVIFVWNFVKISVLTALRPKMFWRDLTTKTSSLHLSDQLNVLKFEINPSFMMLKKCVSWVHSSFDLCLRNSNRSSSLPTKRLSQIWRNSPWAPTSVGRTDLTGAMFMFDF